MYLLLNVEQQLEANQKKVQALFQAVQIELYINAVEQSALFRLLT